MRYALLNGIRVEATHDAPRTAYCKECKESVFLRCPSIIIPHWVHHAGSECVHAGKTGPETDWHKNWKWTVPERYREVSIRRDGKLRRADIRAATKTVIELQHSDIATNEVEAREDFYGKNMFWMFDSDGRKRVITRLQHDTKVFPLIAGMKIYKCQIWDTIPGLFEANRAKLVDLDSEVIRIVPHVANSRLQFLCHIQGADTVRSQFTQTCDCELPVVDSFLMSVSQDWAPRKLIENMKRAEATSNGKYMTDYCPRGYMPQVNYPAHLSPEAWAEIMRED